MDEDEIYLKRLDGGLFTLQLVDYIMLEICAGSPPSVKQRVTLILNQRGASLKTIRHIMRGIWLTLILKNNLFCSAHELIKYFSACYWIPYRYLPNAYLKFTRILVKLLVQQEMNHSSIHDKAGRSCL